MTLSLEVSVLLTMESLVPEANAYAESFGLGPAEAAFYNLFASLRRTPVPLGLKGAPFILRHDVLARILDSGFPGFFTMTDLEQAVTDDFLDAARGSTDNRKGWQVRVAVGLMMADAVVVVASNVDLASYGHGPNLLIYPSAYSRHATCISQ